MEFNITHAKPPIMHHLIKDISSIKNKNKLLATKLLKQAYSVFAQNLLTQSFGTTNAKYFHD